MSDLFNLNLSLKDMLAKVDPSKQHLAVDWGTPVGNERFWLDSWYVKYIFEDEVEYDYIKAESEEEAIGTATSWAERLGASWQFVSEEEYVEWINNKICLT